MSKTIKTWGEVQQNALEQMRLLVEYGDIYDAALMADHHLGYSMPIGGVVAYRDQISPSGVGFDIACGNKAVRTNLKSADIANDLPKLADEIFGRIAFGVGRVDGSSADHTLFDDDRWNVRKEIASLKEQGRQQLGTVGSGNHYVDVFVEDATDDVWVGVHFGSRGIGHKIATGYLKLDAGFGFFENPPKGERVEKEEPTLLSMTGLGAEYMVAMSLAGDYAYAGRDYVVDTVLKILGAEATMEVHNHHNYAWIEEHGGEQVYVVRKGATPLWPGQQSFIGGSMCGLSVIVEGVDCPEAIATMRSTVHGAGRVMGRMEAKGKWRRGECLRPGKVTPEMMSEVILQSGIELRGGGLDESPFVYRQLRNVLDAHSESTKVLHELRPLVVCMAGPHVRDPYKD